MGATSTWTFLTNHAIVLVLVARQPRITLRELSDAIGITERAVSRIVGELGREGYLDIEKEGRRNVYEVRRDALLRRSEMRPVSVGELLAVLLGPEGRDAELPPGGDQPARRRSA